jgi:hypothetical protein
MIRVNRPVKLLEWGEGTNTTNQCWSEVADGKIVSINKKDGNTLMIVEIKGRLSKQNPKDDNIKIAQLGEGMAPLAERWGKIPPSWGEIAMGRIRSVDDRSIKSIITIEIPTATKTSRAFE